MGFIGSVIKRLQWQRAAFGCVPLLACLVLCFASIRWTAAALENRWAHPRDYPHLVATLGEGTREEYVELKVVGRRAETDVLALGWQDKPIARFSYLELPGKDSANVLLLGAWIFGFELLSLAAKLACGRPTEKSKCPFELLQDKQGGQVVRGWVGKLKGSSVLKDYNEVAASVTDTEMEQRSRKEYKKARLSIYIDAHRSSVSLGQVIQRFMVFLICVTLAALDVWWFYPRDYHNNPMYLRMARINRTARQVEADIDTELALADPAPLHLPGGSIMIVSYVVMVTRFELKVHYIGDIETYKQSRNAGSYQNFFFNKREVFLFGFGFRTEVDARENVRDMLARRDMLRESEHWREFYAKARAQRNQRDQASVDPEAELRRRQQASAENYKALSLSQGASREDVIKAWRKIALKWHPDRHTNPEVKAQAEPIFKRATQAKEELLLLLGAE